MCFAMLQFKKKKKGDKRKERDGKLGKRREGEEERQRKDCSEWGLVGDHTTCLVHYLVTLVSLASHS